MKNTFESAKIELIELVAEDIISTSNDGELDYM